MAAGDYCNVLLLMGIINLPLDASLFQFGLDKCSPSFLLDDESSVIVSNCTHSGVTVQFNIEAKDPFVVTELIYNNSNDENVKIGLLSGDYLAYRQVIPFTIEPPLNSSVTEWMLQFCYEDNSAQRFVLKPFTCKIKKMQLDVGENTNWYSSPSDYPIHSTSLSSSIELEYDWYSSIALTPTLSLASVPFTSMSTSSNVITMPATQSSTLSTILPVEGTKVLRDAKFTSLYSITPYSIMLPNDKNSSSVITTTSNAAQHSTTSSQSNVILAGTSSPDITQTALIITVCVCATVITISFAMALCIVRLTKQSRNVSILIQDEQSCVPIEKDTYNRTPYMTPSPSIVTDISPLKWEFEIHKVYQEPYEDQASINIQSLFKSNNIEDDDPRKCRILLYTTTDRSTSDFSTSDSDTSNNTVNFASSDSGQISQTTFDSGQVSQTALNLGQAFQTALVSDQTSQAVLDSGQESKILLVDSDQVSQNSNGMQQIDIENENETGPYSSQVEKNIDAIDDKGNNFKPSSETKSNTDSATLSLTKSLECTAACTVDSQYYNVTVKNEPQRAASTDITVEQVDDSLNNGTNNVYIVLNSSEHAPTFSNITKR